MGELKPCPFCGGKPVLEKRKSAVMLGKYAVHIYCPDKRCGADFWFYGHESDEEEVIKRFNRRAT